MAKFRFSLDPVLELRRREEDVLKRDLAVLEAERRAIEDRLRTRQTDIVAGKSALRESLMGVLDPTLLRQQATATMAVDRLARRSVLDLAGQAQRIATARQALAQAAQRRRAIELLRERKLADWNAEQRRVETSNLDELATTLASRRRDEISDRTITSQREAQS